MTDLLNKKQLSDAKRATFLFLKVRDRSEKEIRDRLLQKKIPNDVITETLNYFKKSNFVNDRQFAKAWIRYRLAKPYGINRIRLELKEKGIQPDIIKEELVEASSNYAQEETILGVIKKRWPRYKTQDPIKAKQKLYGYLARRGFSLGAIKKALNLYDDSQ